MLVSPRSPALAPVMAVLLLAATAAAAAMSLEAQAQATSHRSIRVVVDPARGYVFHLLAVAGVGYDSPYGERYRNTVPASDRELLATHARSLSFADGQLGPLAAAFVFLPLNMGLDSGEALAEFFSLLLAGVEGETDPFQERYRQELDRVRLLLPFDAAEYLPALAPYRDQVAGIAGVYRRNWDVYLRHVWPAERPTLEARAAMLESRLRDMDLIRRWEEATGTTFKLDRYELALSSAMAGGPDAVSVAYGRNHFHHDRDPDHMVQFISHEVGTHVLIDSFNQVMASGMAPFPTVYAAYESLALFYNREAVLGPDGFMMALPEYDSTRFARIYGQLREADPEITPDELLGRGIQVYLGQDSG